MHSMEKGPSPVKPDNDSDSHDGDAVDRDEDDEDQEGRFRIRIPTGLSVAQPGSKVFGKVGGQKFNPGLNHNNAGSNFGPKVLGKRERERERERERDPVGEVVSAIKVLGDGFDGGGGGGGVVI